MAYGVAPFAINYFLDRSGPGLPSVHELEDQTVVIVRTPSSLGGTYRFGVPTDEPPVLVHALRFAAVGLGECTVHRVDARTLDVRVASGLLNDPLVALYRDAPVRRGERVRLSDMELEVIEEDESGPVAVRLRFTEPLEAPGRTWVAWDAGRFVRFRIPAVGETVTLQN